MSYDYGRQYEYGSNSANFVVSPEQFRAYASQFEQAPANTMAAQKEPSMNTSTKTYAVRTKAGYLGQIVLIADGEVLWESKPKKTREKALKVAEQAHVEGVRATYSKIEAL